AHLGMEWMASLRIGFTSWRTVPLLFSSCLALIGALERAAQKPFCHASTALEPCVSHDHGRCDIAASGAHGASQRLMTSQVIAGTPLGTHTQRRQSVQA